MLSISDALQNLCLNDVDNGLSAPVIEETCKQ